MLKFFIFLFFSAIGGQLVAQQLYMEAFTGRNRTNYNIAPYETGKGYWPLGLRVAAGADRLQLGAEYSTHLSRSKFEIKDTTTNEKIGEHQFKSIYYGLFLRSKISRYPARRFGITLLAGAGYLNVQRSSSVDSEIENAEYKRTLAYSGGVGIAIPSQSIGMVELGYYYYYTDLAANGNLPSMIGSYHSIHLGVSLNFVFGQRKKEYFNIMKKI